MKIFNRILIIAVPFLFIACTYSSSVDITLDSAGKNRNELLTVLNYYKSTEDVEKSLAANYIISNMHGHYVMAGDWDQYYKTIDSILSLPAECHDVEIKRIQKEFDGRIYFQPMEQLVSASYLLQNIEQAYDKWKNGGYADHLNFEIFCEYLLPPICSDTQALIDWRGRNEPFARGDLDNISICYDYNGNTNQAVSTVNQAAKKEMSHMTGDYSTQIIPIYDASLFSKFPHPFSCTETSEMAVLTMRSKGLPVTMDFTPQWPDGQHGHCWTVVWSQHGKAEPFSPFWSPLGVPFISHRRFAKVFRRTYAPSNDYNKLLAKNPEIHDFIGSSFFKDVTEEYTATSNIRVRLKKKAIKQYALIAVFDNEKWKPVWYGKSHGKTAEFTNMGHDAAYIVLSPNKHGTLLPISEPFILDRNGGIKYLGGGNNKKINMIIDRKAPLRRVQYDRMKKGEVFTDKNAIVPGHEYEVYFWTNDKWETLQNILASDSYIRIDNAPEDCLFYIRDLDQDGEQRIFTYNEAMNKVIWH